jgi:hypothetical protein
MMISAELWVAVIVGLAAIVALYFTGKAAYAALAQITQQAELFREAAQPILWADIRGDVTGELLLLLVGNSGPSIARNVKVTFEPAPPALQDIEPILEMLRQGLGTMAPGRTMEWGLGTAHNTVDWDADNQCHVRIEAEGPFGPIEPVEYVIIINDLKGSRGAPLRAIALDLQKISKGVEELNKSVKRLQPGPRTIQQLPPRRLS